MEWWQSVLTDAFMPLLHNTLRTYLLEEILLSIVHGIKISFILA